MSLEIAKQINVPKWVDQEPVKELMNVLGVSDKHALFVGGSVRNQLLNKPVEDIDIATVFKPNEILDKLKANNIKAIPTGIDHGTVTAVIEGQSFEITTLRHDIETDGRHADVAFTDDWVQDAQRRDFTMNTLLMDMDGNIYDPLGSGIEDLEARQVKFVGQARQRIEEDYLRILRFFRFHAFYGQGEMDSDALQACADAASTILTLSRERITSEFLKILSVDEAPQILRTMFDHNILKDIADKNYQPDCLKRLCALQVSEAAINVMSRLYVLNGNQPKFHDDILRLTHKQKNFLVKLVMATRSELFSDEKSLKKAIFYHGNDLMLQGYLIYLAQENLASDQALLEILKNWQAPECPITGDALIAEGYVTGPDLGQEFERRREEWLDSVI